MTRIKGNIMFVIIMVIIIIGFIFIFSIINRMFDDTLTNNNNSITTTEYNKIANDEDSDTKILGTYTIESENELSYYKSIVIINNYTNSSIDFNISTVHGRDKENVNVGEVKGTAKKINDSRYIFEEAIDENTNRILFEFSITDNKQHLTIKEEYPNSINPYGGHGVYFSGEYNKEL